MRAGRVVARKRLPLELPFDATAWAKGVRTSGAALKEAVTALGCAGAPAVVTYRSPTQAVDMASFQLRSTSQCCTAAMLTCTEALRYSAGSAVCRAVAVGRDRSGSKRQTHVVVAAERLDVVRALVEMIESAGLTFDSATPIDAAIMAGLLRKALRHSGPQQGWLHFGEHSSFFILGGQGAVRFERSISLGVETIAKSLTRPIRLPEVSEPIELASATGKKILHEHGIPESDDEVVNTEHELTRRHIMPLIQPVLQRFIVELRQSLRFGLSEESERQSINITMTGPGSTIPGFAALIAWELRLNVDIDPHYAGYDYLTPASPGSELMEAVGTNRGFLSQLNLQPSEVARRRQLGQMRRWLWSGAAAALAVVGADAYRLHLLLGDAENEAAALATASSAVKSLQETEARLLAVIGSMDELEQTIAAEVGTSINLRAILHEFSRITPESVRITSMQIRRNAETMTGRISGRAAPIGGTKTELEPFIEALKGSPLFENVVLRNVQVDSLGPTSGQRFDVGFEAVPVPGPEELEEMAAADGGSKR